MFVPTILSILLRLLLRRGSLPPSKGSLAIYVMAYLPALFLSRYLQSIGTSRRDPTTGAIISSGEDLNQPGVTEWCFDVLYVTCTFKMVFFTILVDARMQGHARSEAVRSVIGFGTSTSWYAILPPLPGSKLMASKIPSYAAFKMWSNFIGPMISRSRGDNSKTPADEKSTLSKRQEKLRKRSEKGDPRVRTVRK